MKKLLIIPILAAVAFAGCKKKNDISSHVATVSSPTINFTGSQYVSIQVGGTVPTIGVTAYDSTLKEVDKVIDTGAVDVNTPGLYVQTAYSTNSNGYVTTAAVYIAVTNVSDNVDMTGAYTRLANSQVVNVSKLARGLFMTDNIGGVIPPSTSIIPAVFAVIDDTTMVLSPQPSVDGSIYADNCTLSLATPITFSYVVENASFGTSQRVFVHN